MSDEELGIETPVSLEAVRDEWTELAASAGNIFSTFEWGEAWYRHLGQGRQLALAVCRRPSGEAAAILPLFVARRRPLRILRFIGAGPSDQLGVVCAAADRPAAIAALRRFAATQLGGNGLFLAERLWGADGDAARFDGPLLRRAASPVIPIAGRSFDEFLGTHSPNFRNQVRRRERKLAREHVLTYRLTEDPARLEDDMATLIELHAARWRGGDSRAFDGLRGDFHRDFAARALERGWLRLWIMEVDGHPAAAWYGFRYGGIESYYQAGRDPSLDSYSVGFVLLCHSIRSAFEDRLDEYRFGLGDEPYKARFTERDPGLDTVAVAAGPRGRAALTAVRLAQRMPAGLRTRAWRFGGSEAA